MVTQFPGGFHGLVAANVREIGQHLDSFIVFFLFNEFHCFLLYDKMLLDDWKDRTDERMLEVKKILREVIKEKEGSGLLNFLRAIN